MFKIWIRRLVQVFHFGWKDARSIKQMGANRSRLAVFIDIFHCFMKYYVSGLQYMKNRFWELPADKKVRLAKQLGEENRRKDEWLVRYYKNWRFINDYSGVKWETSQVRRTQRNKAYSRFYKMGNNCWTQYGVSFLFEHYSIGSLSIGDKCFFARNVDIDFTGDLTIENNVAFSEGVKVLTHNHELDFTQRESMSHGLIKTPLVIHDSVRIGAHVIIMPGVSEIGRGAMISSGALLRKRVPPYAIVMGNPSMIVGFRYTPDQILELEEDLYPEEKRISEEELMQNYSKYYLKRLQEIKHFLGN